VVCFPYLCSRNTAQTARLFAALNVAIMDALIACWRAKFTWGTTRPTRVIRARLGPEFLPHLLAPAFPRSTTIWN
jgi:hypothetical protein